MSFAYRPRDDIGGHTRLEHKAMRKSAIVWAVAGNFVLATEVSATAILRLSSGTGTIIVEDGSAADANPAIGAISYSGNVGSTVFSAITASGIGSTGSASYPDLRLTGSATPLVAGVQLTISFSDTNYSPVFLDYFSFTTSGVQQGHIDVVAGASDNNVPFELQLPIGSFGTDSPGAFAYSSVVPGSFMPTYSLTELLVVRPEVTSTFSVGIERIDEPSTVGILSICMLLLTYLKFGRATRSERAHRTSCNAASLLRFRYVHTLGNSR
jgi:hypothetical protein